MMDPSAPDFKETIQVLASNFISQNYVCVTSVLGIITCLVSFKIFQYIRSYFPVKVNCWFCNTNCKVPAENQNSWYCNNCQQYNGFSEDGGYNKIIPEQHYASFNPEFADRSISKPVSVTNGLCKNCNTHQELKRAQLASFEPLDSNNFDWEVDAFSELLERNYKLCSYCEKVVSSTLENQIKNLNLSQLITSAGHKLATSSVRFLHSQKNPVDLALLFKNTKRSLWISCLLMVPLIFENYDKLPIKTVFNGKLEEFYTTTKDNFPFLIYSHSALKYLLDHLSKFSLISVTSCSLTQILQSCDHTTFVDYIIKLGWMMLLCLELSFKFIETQLDLKSAQISVLAIIFTVSLWKYVYFNYFFHNNQKTRKFRHSPASKRMTPEIARNDFSATVETTSKEVPQLRQRGNNKSKTLVSSIMDSDLGIGLLNLGSTKKASASNSDTKNVFSTSNENFPSKRRPLIRPARLNFDLQNEVSEINIPFSRPSSQSSGYETLNKSSCNSQNSSLNGDDDYDFRLNSSSPLQLSNYNFGNMMRPFVSSPTPSPYELYTYYHFTAKFQASYGAQASHNSSNCSSCAGSSIQMNSNKWLLIIFFMFVLVVLQESFIIYSILNR